MSSIMFRKILCFFGFHKYVLDPIPSFGYWDFKCKYCNKQLYR